MVRWGSTSLVILAAWGCGLNVVGQASPRPTPDGGAFDAAPTTDASADGEAAAPVHAQTALAFEAASKQFVNFDHIPLPASFTVEAWVKPASVGAQMMIVAEDRTLNKEDQFRLALLDSGLLYFAMSDRSSSYHGLVNESLSVPEQFALRSPAPLPVGTWSHVAVTKNGADFALLVNADVVATFKADSDTFERNLDFDFRIAARMGSGGPEDYFDGTIDEVRLYSRARTSAEIASDRSTEIASAAGGSGDLALYLRFDEGSGGLAHDDLGRSDGTLENGPSWVASDAF